MFWQKIKHIFNGIGVGGSTKVYVDDVLTWGK